jgi:YD repeat-containing protein
MVWYIQDKDWIAQGTTVPADAVAGLKDSLRSRLLGTQKNENITISGTKNGGFTISSKKCTISFNSDTAIDWKEAELLPTCLEIKDYRNAKLHVMVDGAYKTVLNITSTCDLFYCEGKAPTTPPVDNRCKCDSLYNKGRAYTLGNIVRFGGTCYIAKKAEANGKIPVGSSPGQNDYWSKLCDMDTVVCGNMFTLNFNSPSIFETDLKLAAQALLNPGEYTVQSSYPVNNTILASKALITRPSGFNQVLVSKTVAVQPNKQYMISFEGRVLIDRYSDVKLTVNGRSLKTYRIHWKNPKSYVFFWTNTSNSSAAVSLTCTSVQSNNPFDLIAIDNFGMQCMDNNVSIGNSTYTSNGNGVTIKDTTYASRPQPIDPLKPPSTRYIPPNACGCNGLCDAELPSPEMPIIPCDSIQKELAEQQATEAYNDYRDSVFKALLEGYYEKCMQSLESFSMEYRDAEYHYTLYYYDQSGNLVRTVPPAGVKPLASADLPLVRNGRNSNGLPKIPAHILHSTYQHNSLNAVVKQQTPDAGVATFYYDALGRIALSQNAQQKTIASASYASYDPLGRTVEVGVIDVGGVVSLRGIAYNHNNWTNFVNSRSRTEITKTFYDKPILPKINIAFGSDGQQNLRNRIGTVAWFAKSTDLPAFNYQHATHYSYDIAGNVTTLLQDFGTTSDFGSNPANVRTQSKKIDYRFDLVSGKVNEVHYQKGYADQFMYKYEYNADNKLTKAFSSANGLVWENDARYYYYRHGPLARTELGSDKIQGTDYAYTLQGWMKGANGLSGNPKEDMGQDGRQTTVGPNNIGYQLQNKATTPDVYSYWLGYYQADYKAIGSVGSPTVANTIAPLHSGLYHSSPAQLYNGNIRSMYTNIQPFGGLGMLYSYDQLNRIKKQTGFNLNTNAPLPNSAYTMALEYDPNGNIQKLLRNGTVATPAMDDLQYHYYTSTGGTYTGDPTATDATNKLAYVTDAVGATAEPSDIESQPANNYTYDAIGNLVTDTQEGLNIRWNVQNKITYIKKANGNDISYSYDALGNRIKKEVASGTPGMGGLTQYYVRDAQGNTLAIYEMKNNALHWAEQHLYGSSRLGIYQPNVKLALPLHPLPPLTTASTTRHSTQYELTNHLGNVLATVSGGRNNGNTATVITATDYYAFGMGMPGRIYNLNSSGYRFGMNGQEKSNEIFENSFSAQFWEYDSRIGRRWDVDPVETYWQSPYATFDNMPIFLKDPDGLQPKQPGPIKKFWHGLFGSKYAHGHKKMNINESLKTLLYNIRTHLLKAWGHLDLNINNTRYISRQYRIITGKLNPFYIEDVDDHEKHWFGISLGIRIRNIVLFDLKINRDSRMENYFPGRNKNKKDKRLYFNILYKVDDGAEIDPSDGHHHPLIIYTKSAVLLYCIEELSGVRFFKKLKTQFFDTNSIKKNDFFLKQIFDFLFNEQRRRYNLNIHHDN